MVWTDSGDGATWEPRHQDGRAAILSDRARGIHSPSSTSSEVCGKTRDPAVHLAAQQTKTTRNTQTTSTYTSPTDTPGTVTRKPTRLHIPTRRQTTVPPGSRSQGQGSGSLGPGVLESLCLRTPGPQNLLPLSFCALPASNTKAAQAPHLANTLCPQTACKPPLVPDIPRATS